jgi:hypothetical protein
MTSERISIASLTVTAGRELAHPFATSGRQEVPTLNSPLRSAVPLRYSAPPRREDSQARRQKGSQRSQAQYSEGKINEPLAHDTTIPRSTPQDLPAPRR